jgi:hypothetical protein
MIKNENRHVSKKEWGLHEERVISLCTRSVLYRMVVGVVKSGKEEACGWPFVTQVLKSETCCWTQKLNREDYGVHKHWVLVVQE